MCGAGKLCAAHGGEDGVHFCPLLLATDVGAELVLAELEGALVLADAQEFHAALLVRCEAGGFTDDVLDELDALVLLPLPPGDARSRGGHPKVAWAKSVMHRNR